MRDVFLETDAFAEMARVPKRSPEFWEALIALGGTPEQVAPHLPEMTEAEVAGELASARGRRTDDADGAAERVASLLRTLTERPDQLRSSFGRRFGIHHR